MHETDCWIDGRTVAVAKRMTATSPVDGSVVLSVGLAGQAELNAAVTGAHAASRQWSRLPPGERCRLLRKVADLIRANGDELISIECLETGKLRSEMAASLKIAADYFDYYGEVARAFFGDTIDLGGDQHAFTKREAYGVVGIITPWNGPLTQAARGAAAAMAVGNCVVLKPSQFTPTTSVALARLCIEAGIPAGVLNVVTGAGADVGDPLVAHPLVSLVAFTGSVEIGRAVARKAADLLKPTLLELGGKSANIVFDDADLAGAAKASATICVSSGQQCAALSRLLVHESVEQELIERVTTLLKAAEPGERLAPLTTQSQFEKVKSYFKVAEEDGARLVLGGRAATDGVLAQGRYVYPTIYAGVRPGMRVFHEEIFGPVLCVTTFRDEREAIEMANDSEFGLVSSVWTRDGARALRVASEIHAGQVMVNGGRTGVDTPFGGYKASGWGREKGFEALNGYTRMKTTVISLN